MAKPGPFRVQRSALCFVGIFSTLFAVNRSFADDWPHWRGPNRNDISKEVSGWKDGAWLREKPTWTTSVGRGASSPLIVADHIYTLGWQSGKDVVRCLSAKSGQEIWSKNYNCPQYGRHAVGDEGLYSGSTATPEFDATTGHLYTLSCDGDLNCWNTGMNGELVWKRNLYDDYKVGRRPKLTRAPQRDYGYTASPMIHGDWLLVEVGSPRGSLVAFDKKTGREVWRSELKDEAGHTGGPSPIMVEGIPCVAVLTQRNLAVIRFDAGREGQTLATFPWVTDFANTIAGPAVHGNHVLLTAAYNHNAICKIKITTKGAEEVWRKKFPSKVCTPVIHSDSVYVAWQQVRCLNWETGELRWEGGKVSDPGSCIVTADDRIIVYGGNGKLMLLESAKRSPTKYTELAVQDRLFESHAWPHVALSNGRIFCRDREGNFACFEHQ